MTIIALDIGSNMGCYIEATSRVQTIKFDKEKRFLGFYQYLTSTYKDTKFHTIAYEDAKFQPGNAAPVFHGFVSILKFFALQNDMKVVPITVKTIKKHITGNGNADKDQMMVHINKRGYEFIDHNSADAIAVYITYKDMYEDA